MESYVRAIYDFTGDPGSTELSITAGEILSVTSTDVGEGWWEGRNNKGKIGLFPAAYVEVMPKESDGNRYDPPDDWDDDWDDDNEYSTIPVKNTADTVSVQSSIYEKNLPGVPNDDSNSISGNNTTTLKRAGMFGRSSDAYILGAVNKEKLSDNEIIKIIQSGTYYQWQSNTGNYTVVVASPKKETKFKGMKSYIAYQLTPSFNNISVARRYKHFDWLHERLVEKFCLIPIPPLPDKQISGRYEEQFVEHRRIQLQEFVDWMCRHPVLSNCEVWMHFLTCTEEKNWKLGKRKAERDTYVGVTYCWAISPPEKQLMPSEVDPQIDGFTQFIHAMEIAIKNLFTISNETAKRYQIQCKKEFQRIGDSLSDLAKALNIDERRSTQTSNVLLLSDSVGRIGGIFIGIGQLFADQPKLDWIPLCDRLHIYRGVLNSFPDIMSTHKGAMQKRKECERLTADQRMNSAQMIDVNRRTDVITYAVLAEMTHFKEERETHLKQTLKSFIEEQIKFYKNVVLRLEDAYRQFD